MTPEKVLELVNAGESETVEFKAGLPNPTQIAQHLAAFANASGGSLVLGVSEQSGTPHVVGVDADRAEIYVGKALQLLEPSPAVLTTRTFVGADEVVVVEVVAGRRLTLAPSGLFVRTGERDRPLTPSEVVDRVNRSSVGDSQREIETLAKAATNLTNQLEEQKPLLEKLNRANSPWRKGFWVGVGAVAGAVAKELAQYLW
ncbi:ATP-binding protein [Nocardioides sp. NBC_00850]|uniref:AlbA family DNA-binding domain-containing protein n=1 Tax=Nocardioides sp. NBC_00850 TaxID=2976001 RepID=UPI00386811AF|nr:ATP-binding protein [Nocardioides sp. NBC_00850]